MLHGLAAGTVHDVNNLLTLVIGCADMALDDETLHPRTRPLLQVEAFFATKSEGQGFGLGPAVVRAIVDELGGRIDVTTVTGQRTMFTIDLPQAAP